MIADNKKDGMMTKQKKLLADLCNAVKQEQDAMLVREGVQSFIRKQIDKFDWGFCPSHGNWRVRTPTVMNDSSETNVSGENIIRVVFKCDPKQQCKDRGTDILALASFNKDTGEFLGFSTCSLFSISLELFCKNLFMNAGDAK